MVVKRNKKGWIKVVEAFMAIVFLLGFLMIVITTYNNAQKDTSAMQKLNFEILNGIETQVSLRNSVFSVALPTYSNESGFPSDILSYAQGEYLSGENCSFSICEVNSTCNYDLNVNSDVYSSEVLLFANQGVYSPRKLKIFCYT